MASFAPAHTRRTVAATLIDNANAVGNRREQSVDRRSGLTFEEFVREYREPRRPVILTDAIRDWPALKKWYPEFFKEHYGSTLVTVDGRYGAGKQQPQSLHMLIDRILGSSHTAPGPYLKNLNLVDHHPELRADISPIPRYAFPNWLMGPLSGKLDSRFHRGEAEIHIGGQGAAFPSMHYDYGHIHSFLSQIYGRKLIKAISPAQTRFVYPQTGENHHGSRIPDIDNVDYEQFPLFAHAVLLVGELEPGDSFFMPAGWWHTTRMSSVSITTSYNFANASNWTDLSRECGFMVPLFPRLRFQTYLLLLRLFRSVLGR
jgi:hypothetical protein